MTPSSIRVDLSAAVAVTMLAVPQGIAYALIAGLPPSAGLYAAALPVIVGALARSSRVSVTGPTNAVSLLVGGALGALAAEGDALQMALQLAVMVGALQVAAGALRLGALVDYISRAVVLGYITGAALLVGLGQLGNITGTPMGSGGPVSRAIAWVVGLGTTDWRALVVAGATVAALLGMRRLWPKLPGATVVLAVGIVVSWALDFHGLGLATAGDIAPVPAGLPPLAWPMGDLASWTALWPLAVAVTVLSLVESSAVARSLAAETGERVDMSREFFGQGLANVTAGLSGGYPVSGSLARSAIHHQSSGSRVSGVLSGVLVLIVLLAAGPVVDLTPVASLAGLLLVVAWDLIDRDAIRTVAGAPRGDRLAFLGTVIGTWTLPLDTAIYLGVGISVALFLWRVRNLRVNELVVVDDRIRESTWAQSETPARCTNVRAIHVEGNLFFGAANELEDALREAVADPKIRVLVVRLKRARGLDFTTAGVLNAARERLHAQGRHLLLAGMTRQTMKMFDDVGLAEAFGPEALFPTETEWFVAMNRALRQAMSLAGPCEPGCPLPDYLDAQDDEDRPITVG